MTVVLKPRELGEVAVKIVTEGGAVSVTLSAANPETAKILDRNTALLTSQLQDGGVNIRDILTIAPSSASEDMGLNFEGGEFSAANGNNGGGQGQGQNGRPGRQLGEEPLTGEIDGTFTPDDFMQRRMSLWRSV
jgi:flagellar hook-length control protein FliK